MSDIMHLGESEVSSLLSVEHAIDALRRFHYANVPLIADRKVIRETAPGAATLSVLSAWQPGEFIAAKQFSAFPSNTTREPPLPSGQGLVVLLDGATGQPLMTCDGAALTRIKTAADSALGADLLARSDSATLLIVGAGALAPEFIRAMKFIRPTIERVLIWNRGEDRAALLAAKMSGAGIECIAKSDLGEAIAEADIVSSLTMTTEPLVRGRYVRPGTHVDLVGSYQPDMREADDALIAKAGRLFVDTKSDCEMSGDVCLPLASGALTKEMIAADLFDLCSGGQVGRRSSEDITIFKNVGGPHLDLAVAAELYRRALV